MKKSFYAVLAVILFTSCDEDSLVASGKTITESRSLEGFDKLNINAGKDIKVIYGEQMEVIITGSDNLVRNLRTKINNGQLTLDYNQDQINQEDLEITIVLPHFKELRINGRRKLKTYGTFKQTSSIAVLSNGENDIVCVDPFPVENVDIKLTGTGKADLRTLSCDRAKADITGDGKIFVNTELSLHAKIHGDGKIYYLGQPHITSEIKGSATEEFSHLEIVGATIQMLLKGVNGELKDAADSSEIMQVLDGNAVKETIIHEALTANPQFPIITGGGPTLRNSQGIPWCASYIHSNGDLTVDLRSNLASESRAKLVYEHLMKFTDDPYVKETLSFLMTREVAHYKMFEAALDSIQPNFPPGVLQADPRFTQQYFNFSPEKSIQGPWNTGEMPDVEKEWHFIQDPQSYVKQTQGMSVTDDSKNAALEEIDKMYEQMSALRSREVKDAEPEGTATWSDYTS